MEDNVERTESGLGIATVAKSGELAVASGAAQAKAMVEARYVIAMQPQNRRKLMDARDTILSACKRPKFAEKARYHKKVGRKQNEAGRWEDAYVDGPSIRFAETAIQAMHNIGVESQIIWEDNERRAVRITVCDYENNIPYSKEVVLQKFVERSTLKQGQVAISERMNSKNEKVYIVAATEEEMANKQAAAESKVMRNAGLRLVPGDFIEEAMEMVTKTLAGEIKDPKAEAKKIADAFSALGVKPSDLDLYLGHPLEACSPAELVDLRAVYTAIKDGEAKWSEYIEDKVKAPKIEDGMKQATGTVVESKTAPETDKPFEIIQTLIKEAGVTEAQVIAFCKERRMCGGKVIEVLQMMESKVQELIAKWPNVVDEIKKIQV